MVTCRIMTLWGSLLILICWSIKGQAMDSLVVGMGQGDRNWIQIMDSSRYVSFAQDSIWLWDMEPGSNLARGIGARRGVALLGTRKAEDGQVIYDGDVSTALDPDQFPEIERTTPLMVYLGGSFRVNRIRLYPRLDRINKHRFLQEFKVSTRPCAGNSDELLFRFWPSNPNTETVVDRRFASRDACYVVITPTTHREWEIAELEVYSEGTALEGVFVSKALSTSRDAPLWGKVHGDGGRISQMVVVQTRTGPDPDPVFYYLKMGDELSRGSKVSWYSNAPISRGPIKPNPAWSPWETLDSGGAVRSPSQRKYIQFRVKMPEPGVCLKQLVFEYAYPPLVQDLVAEVNPPLVKGGEKTEFTLSMEVYLKTKGSGVHPADSGFRQFQIITGAQIHSVERVLIDDRKVAFSWTRDPEGFTVNLWRRVVQDGSFIQVVFQGAILRDQTRFEVRVLDQRSTEQGLKTAYQFAREGDVEPPSPEGRLLVGLEEREGETIRVITRVAVSSVFTPNGDGVNDEFALGYTLLKLMHPVPVLVEIYDLSGRCVRQVFTGEETIGSHGHVWDGRDGSGAMVPPGLYVYNLQVETGKGTECQVGVIGVIY